MSIRLELRDVGVSYGSMMALKPLSLVIEPGEFFCLLGPSGCGKSTTLGVVAGFLQASGGQVWLDGADVTSLPPQKRRLGVVFQNYALFPHMTAAANIGYGLKMQGRPAAEIERRVESLLSLVRLDGKGERYPRQLSGGEQQRVAIARALAIEPKLLLLDEPLSNLDARLREEMRSELKRIQRTTGLTTIFVTHDQGEAFGVGDRVAVLNLGRLEQVGTPEEIYRRPASHFVAGFIGRSNKLPATAEHGRLVIAGRAFSTSLDISGAKGTFYLRPEELRLGGPDDWPNRIEGTVSEAHYSGTLASYAIDTPIGQLELCELATERQVLRAGMAATVSWPAGAGWYIPDGGHA